MDIISILWIVYWTLGAGYGIYLQDQYIKAGGNRLSPWELVRWQWIVMLIWPGLMIARTVKNRKEIRHRQSILIKRRTEVRAQQERQAAIKAKADEAEESWRYINQTIAKRTEDKRKRHDAEMREWMSLEKLALEDAYRRLNYSGIREARLKAQQEQGMGSMEARMLDRILDDKTLDAIAKPEVMDELTPEERQLVLIRQQEIYMQRQRRFGYTGHHHWMPKGYAVDEQGNYYQL